MESLIIVVAGIGGLIMLFIVFRQVNLWYFRINEAVEILKRQEKLLQKIAGEKSATANTDSDKWKCPKCGAINDLSTHICSSCGYMSRS